MSLRRFAGYFLALVSAATIAFASSLIGQAVPPDAAEREATLNLAANEEMTARTAMMFQEMQMHHRLSSARR